MIRCPHPSSFPRTLRTPCTHLEAVLVRHELLGFPLVGGLCRAPWRLGGNGSSGRTVHTLWEVEVRYLDTDVITDDVLELEWKGEFVLHVKKFRKKMEVRVQTDTRLPDNALDELVHCEANVSMNGEHFPQWVLILGGFHVSIQQIPNHLQECWVIVFHLNIHWRDKVWSNIRQRKEKLDDFIKLEIFIENIKAPEKL